MSFAVSLLHTRNAYIADITHIKLGLNNPAASGSKGLNTIVDCLMQGAFESFEKHLSGQVRPQNKEPCRRIVGGKLVETLSRTYVEKASVLFANFLKDFSIEELQKIDQVLNRGGPVQADIYSKFDSRTASPALKKQLLPIQHEVFGLARTLLTHDILTEMKQILTAPAPQNLSEQVD
jgi:hypothetical protein